MNIKKILLSFLGIFILVVGIAIGAYLVKSNQDIREKAAPATVAYISPATQDAQVGKDVSFFVKMDSGVNQIIGVDVRLNFDPNIFQITSLEKGASAGNLDQSISSTFDNTAGKIKYIIYTTDKTKALSGSGLDILRVNAKSKVGSNLASYTISFDPLSSAGGLAETLNILTTLTPGSITLIASDASSSTEGEPNACGGTCGSNYNCKMNYFCFEGFCRNPLCKTDTDCVCSTSTPTTKPTIKATVKPSLKGDAYPTDTPIATTTPKATLVPADVNLTRDEESSDTGSNFDYKLILLIAGILLGIVLLYKGIKSLKKDKQNPPMIDLGQPQTFNDTTQTPL